MNYQAWQVAKTVIQQCVCLGMMQMKLISCGDDDLCLFHTTKKVSGRVSMGPSQSILACRFRFDSDFPSSQVFRKSSGRRPPRFEEKRKKKKKRIKNHDDESLILICNRLARLLPKRSSIRKERSPDCLGSLFRNRWRYLGTSCRRSTARMQIVAE